MGIYIWDGIQWVGGRGTLPPDTVWAVAWAGVADASESILTADGVEVRRNLQPRCRTTATSRVLGIGATSYTTGGWGGVAPAVSIVDDATAPSGSGKITRLTHTAAGTTVAWKDLAVSEAAGTIAATPSTAYQAGIWVRSSAALNVVLSLQGMTSANAPAGSLNGAPTVLTPGQWTLLTAEGVSSATVEKYRVDIDAGGAIAYPAGVTLDIDACIIGAQPYFDGATLPAGI